MTEQNTLAIAELQQKANDGDAQAQFDLALYYANGTAIEKNEELAFQWHKKAAEQGHVNAQFALGLYYLIGEDKRKQQFIVLIKKWSLDKHITMYLGIYKLLPNAHEYLNISLDPAIDLAVTQALSRKLTSVNDDLAFLWLKNAAEQNHAGANYWLGICYRDGIGTQPNDETAFSSFKIAAEQGCPEAYYSLAVCYRDGKGVKQSDNLAFEWITKAVENAAVEPEAYLFLGELYADGKGVAQSDELAFTGTKKPQKKKLLKHNTV